MKRIKLNTLLKYLDSLTDLIIWFDEDVESRGENSDEPTWMGSSMDCPYWITQLYVDKPTDSEGTIDSRLVKDKDGKEKSYLIISVHAED